jgi:hypothetical protein
VHALTGAFIIRLRQPWSPIAVRVLGSWIVATGLLMLGCRSCHARQVKVLLDPAGPARESVLLAYEFADHRNESDGIRDDVEITVVRRVYFAPNVFGNPDWAGERKSGQP